MKQNRIIRIFGTVLLAIIAAALYLIAALNCFGMVGIGREIIRFADLPTNLLMFVLGCFAPITVCEKLFSKTLKSPDLIRDCVLVSKVTCVVWTLFLTPLFWIDSTNAQVGLLNEEGIHLVAYYSLGALSDEDITIDKKQIVFPGIYCLHRLLREPGVNGVSMQLLPNNRVKCDFTKGDEVRHTRLVQY